MILGLAVTKYITPFWHEKQPTAHFKHYKSDRMSLGWHWFLASQLSYFESFVLYGGQTGCGSSSHDEVRDPVSLEMVEGEQLQAVSWRTAT